MSPLDTDPEQLRPEDLNPRPLSWPVTITREQGARILPVFIPCPDDRR